MASIISSKSNQFRYASRIFYSQILRYGRSITPSPLPNHLHHRLVEPQGYGNGSLGLCQRFLSSTAADSPASNSSSKDNSGQEKESGDSNQKSNDGSDQEKESGDSNQNQKSNDGSDQEKESGDSNQKSDDGKSVRGGPVSWLSFLLLVATGAGLIFYYDREKKRHIEEINNASKAVKEGPSAGEAAIGGPFHLINHDGKHVTEKNFLGKWTVMYFGFTHCPDICPDELQKLAAAVDKIKEKAGIEIVPVFISVDPERDTVEQVHEYVKEFHPTLVGLTGSPDEIRIVAKAYRVYYMKTTEEDSDYLVDHSIVMYLMGPDMQFVKYFGKNHDVDSLTDGIIKEVKQYKK